MATEHNDPKPARPNTGEKIADATSQLDTVSSAPSVKNLERIQGTYGTLIKGVERTGVVGSGILQFAAGLKNLCRNNPTAAAKTESRAIEIVHGHEAETFASLRIFIRRAHQIIEALKSVNLTELQSQGENYIGEWAAAMKRELKLDDEAVAVVKNMLMAEKPNIEELANAIGGELGTQLSKVFLDFHELFRAEQSTLQGSIDTESARDNLHKEFDAVTKGAIGTVPEEVVIDQLGAYTDPSQTEELYKKLDALNLLPKKSVLLLHFWKLPLYISWETTADEIKRGLRKALEAVKNGEAGKIIHAQQWERANLIAFFDSLPDGTEFKGTWIRDGKPVELRKTKKGEIDKNSVNAIAKEKEEELDAQTFGSKLEHYVVNLRLK